MEAAKEAAHAADPQDVRARILLGNIHWAAGHTSQASKEYQGALRAGPTSCPLDLYLRLGTSFLAEGEFEYARNVYVQVHQHRMNNALTCVCCIVYIWDCSNDDLRPANDVVCITSVCISPCTVG